ncbi:hypothetical protein B0H67DRAFT_638848 [Lasiosphaeris hirsuta]|uniref:Uncharacterized protein n=1 Tax=Lasiosphaeris hirsuta TaxID=260670 RepID=A0AA40B9U8_9PEZI|nr:hypothetical protein B0H67DRAFT_638848 [Lasiosphaeris hirsuta]
MKRLVEKKLVYLHLLERVREILEKRTLDYRFGHIDNSRAGVRKTLATLANTTPEKFMKTVVASFTRSLLTCVSFVFEPLTKFELGLAVVLSDGTNEKDLEDVDYDELRADVLQFGLSIAFSEHEVRF